MCELRQAKLEQERLQKEEAERQRRLAQETEAKLREEQQLQAQARLRETQEKAAQQEREDREREEKRRAEEKERDERRSAEEKDSKEKGGDGVNERAINPVNSATLDLQSQLSALFNSTAANTTGECVSPRVCTWPDALFVSTVYSPS